MSVLDQLKMYTRFGFGLQPFLSQRISLEEARAMIKKRLAERETNFLRLVERGVFGYSRSPYLPLLKLAGCEFGDILRMVRARGLEETLRALRRAGVYVTFEEFKGREPIVRNGQVIRAHTRDFDNPYLSRYYLAESGGTTGIGTRVPIDLSHLADQVPAIMLAYDAHGVLGVPTAIWRSVLPDNSGISYILRGARFGQVPQRWFTPITSRDLRSSLKYRLATQTILVMGRVFGIPLPWPEQLRLDQASVLAGWIAETLEAHGSCLIRTYVSMALRVCIAARDAGVDLRGATFMGGGEPPTPGKVREITRTGARWIPNYSLAETGRIGVGCVHPADGNDLHFLKDSLALIQCPRQVPGSEDTVDAFYFTTLLSTVPKLMLNVEIDDYGVIESRPCGCPLEAYGFPEHLRHVRSFSKLTGEGMTLVGSDMVRILEEVLPARFGGTPLDYQLLEEEGERGFTQLRLLVSPRIKVADEREVIGAVLEALGQAGDSADLARAIWRQARALSVKRMDPIWTARGKFMPLHVAERSKRRPE